MVSSSPCHFVHVHTESNAGQLKQPSLFRPISQPPPTSPVPHKLRSCTMLSQGDTTIQLQPQDTRLGRCRTHASSRRPTPQTNCHVEKTIYRRARSFWNTVVFHGSARCLARPSRGVVPVVQAWATKPRKASMARRPFFSSLTCSHRYAQEHKSIQCHTVVKWTHTESMATSHTRASHSWTLTPLYDYTKPSRTCTALHGPILRTTADASKDHATSWQATKDPSTH